MASFCRQASPFHIVFVQVQTMPGMPNITYTKVITSDYFCDGIVHCPLTAEDESEARCPDRFRCKAGKKVSIAPGKVCDGIPDCDDMADETNVTCPGRFFCLALGKTKVSLKCCVTEILFVFFLDKHGLFCILAKAVAF